MSQHTEQPMTARDQAVWAAAERARRDAIVTYNDPAPLLAWRQWILTHGDLMHERARRDRLQRLVLAGPTG